MYDTEGLNPCPFCGKGIVYVEQDNILLSGHKYWKVRHCNKSEIDVCPICNTLGYFESRLYSTKEKAIRAWNERA